MKITVIGLGAIGTVAAVSLAVSGHEVLATDVDPIKIQALGAGIYEGHEPGLANRLRAALTTGNIRFQCCDEVDENLGEVALITVGTPAGERYAPELDQVRAAVRWVRERSGGSLVVAMKSTVPPGTGHAISCRTSCTARALVTSPIPSSFVQVRRLPTGTARTSLSSGPNPATPVLLRPCVAFTATSTSRCWLPTLQRRR